MAWPMIVAQIVGAVMKGTGSWRESRTQIEGFKTRAESIGRDADSLERATRYQFSQDILEARRLRARQLVQYAKSGVMMEGTPATVMTETKAEAERDAAFALDVGTRHAQGMRIEAAYNKWMAASAKMGGIFNVLGGGASSAGSIYSGAKQGGDGGGKG